MAIIHDLSPYQSRVDEEHGYREETLFRACGDAQLLTFVYRPLRPTSAARVGVVFFHAYSREQLNTYRFEVEWARQFAPYFPALRVQTRGTGHSSGDPAEVTISSQIADTLDSIRWFTEYTGVSGLVFIGIRLGGTVAALAAQRVANVRGLIMLNPVTAALPSIGPILRTMMMAEMARQSSAPGASAPVTTESLMAEIRAKGFVDVLGNPIYRAMLEETEQLDLPAQVGDYRGAALLIQTGRDNALRPDLQALYTALTAAGASCDVLTDKVVFGWATPSIVMDSPDAVARIIGKSLEWCRQKVVDGPAQNA